MPIADITLDFVQGGKEAVCTFTSANAALVDSPYDLELLVNVAFGWQTYIRPLVSPNCTLVQIRYNRPFYEVVHPVNLAGTLSGIAMPINNAILIQKLVSGAPKGRMYHPGIGTGQADAAGVLNAGHLANWQGAVDNWLIEINKDTSFGEQLMLVSHYNMSGSEVIDLNVKPVVGSQRRRLK